MSSWARAGDDFGGSGQPRRLGALIPVAVIAMALVSGLILGRATATQTVVVRTVPLAPGSTRVESGVPVGYGHSQAGAIAAATVYAVSLNGPMLLDLRALRAADRCARVPR
jgi:pantoate kinase